MELGNIMFNSNANQQYECPRYVIALLRELSRQLSRVYWNKNQKEYDSPFENTGNRFVNNIFEVQAYSWNDENPTEYNFRYFTNYGPNNENIDISWYKYLGRDTTVNQEIEPKMYVKMFEDCLNSILVMEQDWFKEENFITGEEQV